MVIRDRKSLAKTLCDQTGEIILVFVSDELNLVTVGSFAGDRLAFPTAEVSEMCERARQAGARGLFIAERGDVAPRWLVSPENVQTLEIIASSVGVELIERLFLRGRTMTSISRQLPVTEV